MKNKTLIIDLNKNSDPDYYRGLSYKEIKVKNWTKLSKEDLLYLLREVLFPAVRTKFGKIILK